MARTGHEPGQIVLGQKLLERLTGLAANGAIGVIEVQNNVFKVDRGPGYKDLYLNARGENHDPPEESNCC